jgi:hypothetical protein
MDFNELITNVIGWADDKDEIVDGIGDSFVTLIILSMQ